MGVRRDYGCPEEGGSKVAEDTPWLHKGAREIGMTRKGHEKNHPARMQGSGGVLCGEGVLFTPMTEVGDETGVLDLWDWRERLRSEIRDGMIERWDQYCLRRMMLGI